MYIIDTRGLKTSIELVLMRKIENQFEIDEQTVYYTTILLDMIVGTLNGVDDEKGTSLDKQYLKYRGDFILINMGDIISSEIDTIKKQFFLAGHDRRLKYKLVSKQIGNTTIKQYAIVMDIEATVEHFNVISVTPTEENICDAVNGDPTLEELAAMFNYT